MKPPEITGIPDDLESYLGVESAAALVQEQASEIQTRPLTNPFSYLHAEIDVGEMSAGALSGALEANIRRDFGAASGYADDAIGRDMAMREIRKASAISAGLLDLTRAQFSGLYSVVPSLEGAQAYIERGVGDLIDQGFRKVGSYIDQAGNLIDQYADLAGNYIDRAAEIIDQIPAYIDQGIGFIERMAIGELELATLVNPKQLFNAYGAGLLENLTAQDIFQTTMGLLEQYGPDWIAGVAAVAANTAGIAADLGRDLATIAAAGLTTGGVLGVAYGAIRLGMIIFELAFGRTLPDPPSINTEAFLNEFWRQGSTFPAQSMGDMLTMTLGQAYLDPKKMQRELGLRDVTVREFQSLMQGATHIEFDPAALSLPTSIAFDHVGPAAWNRLSLAGRKNLAAALAKKRPQVVSAIQNQPLVTSQTLAVAAFNQQLVDQAKRYKRTNPAFLRQAPKIFEREFCRFFPNARIL